MVTEFFIFIVGFAWLLWYLQNHLALRKGKRLPGPSTLPLVFLVNAIRGAFSLRNRNYEIVEDISMKYGPLLGIKVGFTTTVLINDFELAKSIMSADVWSSRMPAWKFIMERSFNKNLGLIWSTGESWKEMRKYTIRIMRQFGFGKGASMETFIATEMSEFLQYFEKLVCTNGGVLQMHQIFNIPALNLLWTMMAGIRFPYDDEKFSKLIESSEIMRDAIKPGLSPYTVFPVLRYIPGLTEHDAIMDVHERVQEIFRDIIKQRREKGTYLEDAVDFLDVFLKEIDTKNPSDPKAPLYTEEQMIMVCVDLFFSSSDTTSAALSFSILYMILNPSVMEKVQDEIDRVIGFDRMATLNDKCNMPYIEATTLEVLRFSSINPLGTRSCSEDTFINEYFVPKDSVAILLLHGFHFNEKTWGDPLTFRPERFLTENMEIINADKIIPFGYGKRLCIGENLAKASFFIFFTTLMQKYAFKKSQFHPDPTTEPRTGLTNNPEVFYVTVQPREKIMK